MNWNSLSNSAIIEEVGKRLKDYRACRFVAGRLRKQRH